MRERFAEQQNRLLRGMRAYMEDSDAGYSEEHVAECAQILDRYLSSLESTHDRESARDLVRQTVVALNELNVRAGEQMIETDQREQICAIIIEAGALRGFNGADEDVTEDWREW